MHLNQSQWREEAKGGDITLGDFFKLFFLVLVAFSI